MEKFSKISYDVLTKCMADGIFKTLSIKHKIVNVKKHSPVLILTSKILYCHQYSADFTYFMLLVRELFLHAWLTFLVNGPVAEIWNDHFRSQRNFSI